MLPPACGFTRSTVSTGPEFTAYTAISCMVGAADFSFHRSPTMRLEVAAFTFF